MKEQINAQLDQLQKELARLKSVTDYIDETKETADSVILKLESIQKNYSLYTNKIFELYESSVSEINRNAETKVNESINHLETTKDEVVESSRQQLNEVRRLLEHYSELVEATSGLVESLETANLSGKLVEIEQQVSEKIENVKQDISTSKDDIIQMLSKQAVDVNLATSRKLSNIESQSEKYFNQINNKLLVQDTHNNKINKLVYIILVIALVIAGISLINLLFF